MHALFINDPRCLGSEMICADIQERLEFNAPFFFKKRVKKFLSNDQNFLTKFFFGKSFKAWVSLIEKHNVDKNSKHLKTNIIFQIFWIFFEKFCDFFSKEFTAEKFLWSLTLENFSIFYQSLRDYNCGFNKCMVTCRVSKRISWVMRTHFWQKIGQSAISG